MQKQNNTVPTHTRLGRGGRGEGGGRREGRREEGGRGEGRRGEGRREERGGEGRDRGGEKGGEGRREGGEERGSKVILTSMHIFTVAISEIAFDWEEFCHLALKADLPHPLLPNTVTVRNGRVAMDPTKFTEPHQIHTLAQLHGHTQYTTHHTHTHHTQFNMA